jgi:hypothetical protein
MILAAYLVKNPVMTTRVVKKRLVILERVKERTVLMIGCLIWIVGTRLMCRYSVVTQATDPLTE